MLGHQSCRKVTALKLRVELYNVVLHEQAHQIARIRQEKPFNVVFSGDETLCSNLITDHLVDVFKHRVNGTSLAIFFLLVCKMVKRDTF